MWRRDGTKLKGGRGGSAGGRGVLSLGICGSNGVEFIVVVAQFSKFVDGIQSRGAVAEGSSVFLSTKGTLGGNVSACAIVGAGWCLWACACSGNM